MRVRDWMSPDPVTISPGTDVEEARAMLARIGVRHLPVIERHGRLVGMISDRDVPAARRPDGTRHRSGARVAVPQGGGGSRRATSEPAPGESPTEDDGPAPVAMVMTRSVQTIGPDADVAEAARLMLSRRINAVPVVEDEVLIGLLTSSDCLLALLEREGPGPQERSAAPALGEVVPGRIQELGTEEAMTLLAGARLGRLAYLRDGAVRLIPLNYRYWGGAVVVRLAYGPLLEALEGQQVAFEVDGGAPIRDPHDGATLAGEDAAEAWSVVVEGLAAEVWQPDELAALADAGLDPWPGGDRQHYVQIRPTRIAGRVVYRT